MPSNSRVALDLYLNEKNQEIAPEMSESDFFESFVVDQVLKDYDLSWDEIADGNVDGEKDGGIDAFYVFVNGTLLDEGRDLSSYRRDVNIEVFVFQSKTSSGFSETAVDKIAASLGDLLNAEATDSDLRALYNERVIQKASLFTRAWTELASRFPTVSVKCIYATKADIISDTVIARTARVASAVSHHFPDAQFDFEFLNCEKLVRHARRNRSEALTLKFTEGPMPTESGGVLGMVAIKDYYNFLKTDEGRIRNSLFEQNVRDYQGANPVNTSIRETLEQDDDAEFWWLNNGITILCERFHGMKTMSIQDPQIVNGLQTSMEIFDYFSRNSGIDDSRSVLIRVLQPQDTDMRDRITKATNNQTVIPSASLRASDPFQSEIEAYLFHNGLYYDRRKNYYKNQGRPKAATISITALAQAFMSTIAGRPDDARARPSSLLKEDADYFAVFNSHFPLESYRKAILIVQRIEDFLRTEHPSLKAADRNNYRYHIAYVATRVAIGFKLVNARQVEALSVDLLDDSFLKECFDSISKAFDALSNEMEGSIDRVAKSPQSREAAEKIVDSMLQDRRAIEAEAK